VPADRLGKVIAHFPELAEAEAAAVFEPSRYSFTTLLDAGFDSVPEMEPGAVVVPLRDDVTTGGATVTLGSQEFLKAEATSAPPFGEIIWKNVPKAFEAQGALELLLAELIPTALEPMTAEPPESPGIMQIFAVMLFTWKVPEPSETLTVWSTDRTTPQVHPDRLPDLQISAPTIAEEVPVTGSGADDVGAPWPWFHVATAGIGDMPETETSPASLPDPKRADPETTVPMTEPREPPICGPFCTRA
jgi:hypothetical protein